MRSLNRIDHIVICVRPENLASAVSHFTELLDITLEGPFESPEAGLTIYIDWDAGFEVVSPTHSNGSWDEPRRFLEEKGEGIFRLVFGVPDQDAALKRANALGHETTLPSDVFDLNPVWQERFLRIDEALIRDRIFGVGITLGQIERK
jgi:4-hydroxyphenylpyruvate dioxygenase-like putative hemolysin